MAEPEPSLLTLLWHYIWYNLWFLYVPLSFVGLFVLTGFEPLALILQSGGGTILLLFVITAFLWKQTTRDP